MSKTKYLRVLAMTIIALFGLVAANAGADEDKVRELQWDDLIPPGFNPEEVFRQYQEKYAIDELADDDPRVEEMLQKLDEMLKTSPVNTALDGERVKLPGYALPLESDGEKASQFLLVPYFGACIHVPPPPLNQTVYVTTKDKAGATIRKLFDVVWVTGIIRTEQLSTDLADAGYTIQATKVEPYE